MARFTLTSEHFSGTKTTVEFHAEHLDNVLENFKQFLQGSGYVLGTNENIEVVDNSWQFSTNTDDAVEDGPYYMDTEPQETYGAYDPNIIRWDNLDDIRITIKEPETTPVKTKKGKK